MSEMPKLLAELVTMANRVPVVNDHWKRLRIAVSAEELAEMREFFRTYNGKEFYWAVRGVPLVIEAYPKHHPIAGEVFHAPNL